MQSLSNECTKWRLLPLVDMVSVTYLSPLLTHALIKLEPKDYNSPSKHAMNAEMHKCRSFKIIASRLKRCSSWCCHVYIATNTSASKCSKWPNEMKYGILASLIKFEQFKRGFTTKWAHSKYRQEINLVLHMYAKWTTPNKVHTSCHETNLWFDQIFNQLNFIGVMQLITKVCQTNVCGRLSMPSKPDLSIMSSLCQKQSEA